MANTDRFPTHSSVREIGKLYLCSQTSSILSYILKSQLKFDGGVFLFQFNEIILTSFHQEDRAIFFNKTSCVFVTFLLPYSYGPAVASPASKK